MKRFAFPALVLVVVAIGLLHFFTPGNLFFYHDTYRRLSYFPIVLGALWFGLWGGLTLAILSSVAFIPHLLLYLGQRPETYLSELTEVILYLAAGTATGFIAGREARLRKQYRLISEKLEKSYAQLHQETELLIEVEEQLSASQKLSALGQLSASLAHEIKNPLSSIRGTAEILLDEFPQGHPKREFVEILLKETGKLNGTVEDVLRFSRGSNIEAADRKTEREPLSKVLARVGKLLQAQLRGKQIDYQVQGAELGEDFFVDGGRLSQVFLNLVLNAIDAVPKRGRIRLQLSRDEAENGLKITVIDNGHGVPAAQLNSVFQPFVTGKENGTGLGLPISRKIIESHGGRLTVSDADGGGACFTVSLPRQQKTPAETLMNT